MKQIIFHVLLLIGLHAHAQNVGIGTITPTHKLDVAGRVHIRHNSGQTAGIWFDGPSNANRSFVGTYDEDHIGIFGSGSSWKMVMNVETGNVGIGTTAPSAGLDLNGTLRIRGSSPKKGSILTSENISGNASWADPVAFKTTGLDNLANANFPKDLWSKVEFNKSPAYNLSLGYQPLNSQFQAIDGGIYHFDAQFICDAAQVVSTLYVRMVLNRNGNLSTIAQGSEVKVSMLPDGYGGYSTGRISLNTDVLLQPGDIVWLELNPNLPLNWTGLTERTNLTVLGSASNTWFSGHLVTRN